MSRAIQPRQEVNVWIQLLAGPVIWSVHFLLSYLLVEAFCKLGWNFTLLGMHGLSAILLVFTILAVIVAGFFALKSYRLWKDINREHGLREEFRETSRWSEGPEEFAYFSGFLLSLLFAVTILMVGIPALFLQPCV